ncbi:LacI family DNA-binding transcriptional regulator, partial [Nocardia farcinica]|uniref:LacI family DNA-binding transcriptional regulator n=1 Tax=Nocardia farcinica TaxID=37329 RepID=UPI0024539A55
MKEVAAAASVSVGTVSNVLNAPEKVAPATVERVLAAIDRLGFVRNDAGRPRKAGPAPSDGGVVVGKRHPIINAVAPAPRLGHAALAAEQHR